MKVAFLAVSVLLLWACDAPEVELPGDQLGRLEGASPTWSEVYPIFQDNCVRCHRSGQLATYKPMDTYAWASLQADEIAIRVQGPGEDGDPQMPPYTPDATESCAPAYAYSNDLDLTQDEIDKVVAWVDGGALHGSNAEIPGPLVAPAVEPLADATEYTFEEGLTVSIIDESMIDVFRCVIFDPGISARPRWMSGLQINPDVAHLYKGARIMLDRSRESLQYVAEDSPRSHGETWYDCTDGFGFEGELLTTFLPGTVPATDESAAPRGVLVPPFEVPGGASVSIPGDAVFVARILYHPHWAHIDPNDTTEITEELSWVDHTSLSVLWETPRVGVAPATLFHFGNDPTLEEDGTGLLTEPFEVPAGDPLAGLVPHTEIVAATVPGDPTDLYTVWSVLPSMGRWGTTIEVKSTPADGEAEECLGAVADWAVAFQSPAFYSHAVDGMPTVRGGDIVTVTCTYENQSTLPLLLDAGPEQERCEVTLGLLESPVAKGVLAPFAN